LMNDISSVEVARVCFAAVKKFEMFAGNVLLIVLTLSVSVSV
jgi:hypothetical protein